MPRTRRRFTVEMSRSLRPTRRRSGIGGGPVGQVDDGGQVLAPSGSQVGVGLEAGLRERPGVEREQLGTPSDGCVEPVQDTLVQRWRGRRRRQQSSLAVEALGVVLPPAPADRFAPGLREPAVDQDQVDEPVGVCGQVDAGPGGLEDLRIGPVAWKSRGVVGVDLVPPEQVGGSTLAQIRSELQAFSTMLGDRAREAPADGTRDRPGDGWGTRCWAGRATVSGRGPRDDPVATTDGGREKQWHTSW